MAYAREVAQPTLVGIIAAASKDLAATDHTLYKEVWDRLVEGKQKTSRWARKPRD